MQKSLIKKLVTVKFTFKIFHRKDAKTQSFISYECLDLSSLRGR